MRAGRSGDDRARRRRAAREPRRPRVHQAADAQGGRGRSGARSRRTTTSATSRRPTPASSRSCSCSSCSRAAARSSRRLLAPYRERYFLTGEINTPVADVPLKLQELKERYARARAAGSRTSTGSRWTSTTGTSTSGPSNTEPLLRLNLEALSRELMDEKRDEVLALIRASCVGSPRGRPARTGARHRPPAAVQVLGVRRVWFSDTDAQGVVYYGRYLPYFDHARTEYHRHLGGLTALDGSEFVMRASQVEYLAPARFDDLIESFVRVARIGRTSITYECAAWRLPDDSLMVDGDADPRPRRLEPSGARRRSPTRSGRRSGRSRATLSRSERVSTRALEALDRVLNRGGDADDVLRSAVARARAGAGDQLGGNRVPGGGNAHRSALRPVSLTRRGGSGCPSCTRAPRSASSGSTARPRPPFSTASRCSSRNTS